jgi:hypothetical protein
VLLAQTSIHRDGGVHLVANCVPVDVQ